MTRITLVWDGETLSEEDSFELLNARNDWFEKLNYRDWEHIEQQLYRGYYLDHYDIKDEQVALMFKLTWGG